MFSFETSYSSENVIICSVKQSDYSIEVKVLSTLIANIKYTVHEGRKKNIYECEADIINARNEELGVVPRLLFEFKIKSCKPEFNRELKSEILENPNLIVRLMKAKKGYTGSLQWLAKFQPNDCIIPKFDIEKFKLIKSK